MTTKELSRLARSRGIPFSKYRLAMALKSGAAGPPCFREDGCYDFSDEQASALLRYLAQPKPKGRPSRAEREHRMLAAGILLPSGED